MFGKIWQKLLIYCKIVVIVSAVYWITKFTDLLKTKSSLDIFLGLRSKSSSCNFTELWKLYKFFLYICKWLISIICHKEIRQVQKPYNNISNSVRKIEASAIANKIYENVNKISKIYENVKKISKLQAKLDRRWKHIFEPLISRLRFWSGNWLLGSASTHV